MSDPMVLATQKWVNGIYTGTPGYTPIPEDGNTGWTTVYALLHALQIELGITATADNFGDSTKTKFTTRWPEGIKQQADNDASTDHVYAIIQGALWCKGYSTGATGITEHFYGGTGAAIIALKSDAGIGGDSTVTLEIMEALMSMQQFKLVVLSGGKPQVRAIQQHINSQYRETTGLIPTDGVYGREMNTALIQVLQTVEGFSASEATGNFGAGTTSRLTTVSASNAPQDWMWVASAALVCNDYLDSTVSAWSQTVASAVSAFQAAYALPKTGVIDKTTWMSLLTSKGDPDRKASACDCATILNAQQAKDLKAAGYTHVGRYLTGYVGDNTPKAITFEELDNIKNAGLAVFPIYQDGGADSNYFAAPQQGNIDGLTAISAAKRLGFPNGTTIYFAVDFDAYGFQIDQLILPYFRQIALTFNNTEHNSKHYKVGVYGARLVCSQVSQAGYATASFVGDMSTGFAGNLGYPIPSNWAFDQFNEFTFPSTPSFQLDKDANSGRDKGTTTFDTEPKLTEEQVEQQNTQDRINSAKQSFIEYVLSPLGFWERFSSVGWNYGKTIPVSHLSTPAMDVDVSVTISEGVSTDADWQGLINISVDNDGKLSASTENAINSSSATFDVKGVGTNGDFTAKLSSIASSIKAGSISYKTSVTDAGQFVAEIQTTSDNLAPQGSNLTAQISVILTYTLTLHGSFDVKKPTIDPATVAEGVAVVAIIALAVGAAVVAGPAIAAAATGAGIEEGLTSLGVIALAGA